MRSSIFASAAILAVASAQSSSVDPAPQTVYLSQTNSLGVVTGQPAVATAIPNQPAVDTAIPTQPALVTAQPLPDNIPAVGTGVHTLTLAGTGSAFNQTRTVTISANNSTTLLVAPSTTASDAIASGSSGASRSTGASRSGSQTGSGASASPTTGAGAHSFNVAAGGILGFGAFMAAFL